MKLLPLPNIEKRNQKVRKHYFGELERWYQCTGQSRGDWYSQKEHIMNARQGPAVADVLDGAHALWFEASQKAWLSELGQSHRYPSKIPNRRISAGWYGILVVTTHNGDEHSLVTAFRPGEQAAELRSSSKHPSLTQEQWERTGVRRAQQLSSMGLGEGSK